MVTEVEFSEAVALEICDRLEEGETLVEICRDDHMPNRRTVYKWTEDRPEFGAHFARARAAGYEVWFQECKRIADDGTNDYVEKTRLNGDKFEAFDAEHVQRSKLRIETRLKLLARVDPKKYGERTQIAPTDVDGNAAQFAPIMFVPVEAKPSEES